MWLHHHHSSRPRRFLDRKAERTTAGKAKREKPNPLLYWPGNENCLLDSGHWRRSNIYSGVDPIFECHSSSQSICSVSNLWHVDLGSYLSFEVRPPRTGETSHFTCRVACGAFRSMDHKYLWEVEGEVGNINLCRAFVIIGMKRLKILGSIGCY